MVASCGILVVLEPPSRGCGWPVPAAEAAAASGSVEVGLRERDDSDGLMADPSLPRWISLRLADFSRPRAEGGFLAAGGVSATLSEYMLPRESPAWLLPLGVGVLESEAVLWVGVSSSVSFSREQGLEGSERGPELWAWGEEAGGRGGSLHDSWSEWFSSLRREKQHWLALAPDSVGWPTLTYG